MKTTKTTIYQLTTDEITDILAAHFGEKSITATYDVFDDDDSGPVLTGVTVEISNEEKS